MNFDNFYCHIYYRKKEKMKTIHLILSPILKGRIKESSSLNKNGEDDKEYRHRGKDNDWKHIFVNRGSQIDTR